MSLAIVKKVIPTQLRSGLREFAQDFAAYLRPLYPVSSFQLFSFARKVRTGSEGYTMVKRNNLRRLFHAAKTVSREKIPGAVVECGSWNGGAAALCAFALGGDTRDFYAFDSFQGLPKPTEKDGERANRLYKEGWCLAYPEKVAEAFALAGFPKEKLHIVKGWFSDTFPQTPIGDIALLHIDADWYDGVYLCLETFYSKVAKGGFIFFDDYTSWEGCRKAVEDFFKKNNIPLSSLVDNHYIRKI